jgi:hypothetical protein
MNLDAERQGVSGPIDIGAFNEVAHPIVEHVQDRQCRLLRRILDSEEG